MARFSFGLRRIGLFAGSAFVSVVLTAATYPGGLTAAYDDMGEYRNCQEQLDSPCPTDAAHRATIRNLTERIGLKDQFVEDYLAGRISLREITARFIELNEGNPLAKRRVEDSYRGETYSEKAARNVVDFIKLRWKTLPSASHTPQRLAAEFSAEFGHSID